MNTTPSSGLVVDSIDNVGVLTYHHISDAAAYERLGFTVCPLGRQHGPGPDGTLTPWGTGSRCINLARNGYLELMGVVEPHLPTGTYAHDLALRGPGPAKITLGWRHTDIATLAAHGIDALGPLTFTRTLPIEGRLTTAVMDLTILDADTAPLTLMAAHHHDPHAIRHPTTTAHPNGAFGIEYVRVAHPDPHALRRRLEPLGLLDPLPGGGRITIDHASTTAAGTTAEVTGIGIAVIDTRYVAELLTHNQVAYRDDGDTVIAIPEHPGGVPIELVATS